MNMSKWIRQIHRWLSIVFTGVVAAIFIMMGAGKEPAEWVFYLPLAPLFLLFVTGLYMYVLPHVSKARGSVNTGG